MSRVAGASSGARATAANVKALADVLATRRRTCDRSDAAPSSTCRRVAFPPPKWYRGHPKAGGWRIGAFQRVDNDRK